MFIVRSFLLLLLVCHSSFASGAEPIALKSYEQNLTPPAAEPIPNRDSEKPLPPLPSSEEMTDSYQHAFIRMLVSLAGLLALVLGTFWFLKKMGKTKFRIGSNSNIQILEKRSLSPKTVLYLVEVEGKQVLISESQLEVRTLTAVKEIEKSSE